MSVTIARTTPSVISTDPMASENAEPLFEFEIPGRNVHPAKLTAMLRANFGIGAYDIMVGCPTSLKVAVEQGLNIYCFRWLEMYIPSGYLGVSQRMKLLVVGSRESEDMMTDEVAGAIRISEEIDTVTEDEKDVW